MKMTTQWTAILTAVLFVAQASGQESPAHKYTTEEESYALGVDMARNYKRQGMEFDVEQVIKGFRDAAAEKKLSISETELRDIRSTIQNQIRKRDASSRGKPVSELNRRRGAMFMDENKDKPGVISLPSGIQYIIIKEGKGSKPTAEDTVQCAYRGTKLDGTEFVCSNPGKPVEFKVKEPLVLGWGEVVKLMSVGSKWKVFCPPEHAYGIGGVGRQVGPNETLIFELELVAIK
jgi:FKBP-type peptidyl-prolyl cis-trans isomerase FklB